MAESIEEKNKEHFTYVLECTIETEHMIAKCCKRLSELIKNGKVRGKFLAISQASEVNEATLRQHLIQSGRPEYVLEERCKFCKIDPESFSLVGAINFGLEIINAAISCYKDLTASVQLADDKKLFNSLLKEKNEQRDFLKKEQKFAVEKEDKSQLDCIGNYCIPKIISKIGQ
ncbi:MAG: hypothetical protein PHQ96_01800 [Candidatus Omnitrophica bacterium]|nr:hypothetical protein [Candidatus Omnitrophota bacterium]